MNLLKKDFIFQDVNKLDGVGQKLSKYLKKKKIEKSEKMAGQRPPQRVNHCSQCSPWLAACSPEPKNLFNLSLINL